MNIGIVLSQTPQYSETFFKSKIKILKSLGYHVTLFVQDDDPNFTDCDVKQVPSLSKSTIPVRFYRITATLFKLFIAEPSRFFRFIKIERVSNKSLNQIIKNLYNNSHLLSSDLDWVHFGFATISIESENVATSIGAKMAVSFRGYDIEDYPEKHPECYNLLWSRVDKVHAISHYLLNKAYLLGLCTTTSAMVITPAIDYKSFKRTQIDFTETKINIVTIARLHVVKDLESVINAMHILKERNVDFEYKIIGDGPEFENLHMQIERLKLTGVVKLLGRKTPKDVIELLKKATVYVQYSVSEGFCNAVLEAQAVGLLCVVSNGGALPENVIHEKTGWVVSKKNPELLADTILNIIHLPKSIKQKVSNAAQDRIKQDFNLEKHQQLFKAFYEND